MQETNLIKSLRKELIEVKLASSENIRGCSESEVFELEKVFGVDFPSSYRAFLREFGKCAGHWLEDFGYLENDLHEIRNFSEKLICTLNTKGTSCYVLPDNAFVFLYGQEFGEETEEEGPFFLFFLCDGSSDPVIYSFGFEHHVPEVAFDSFSDWIDNEIANLDFVLEP